MALEATFRELVKQLHKLHDALHPDVRPEDYRVGPIAPAEGVDPNAHVAAVSELRGVLRDPPQEKQVPRRSQTRAARRERSE